MKTIHHDSYQTLIEQLIYQRKQVKLTQKEVATILGKPQSYIAKIEVRDKRLDILEFIQICEILSIKPSELLQNTGL